MDFGENYYTDKYQDSEDEAEFEVPMVHRAAARGDIETLVKIVQVDPSVLELQKSDGFTPLAEAVQARQICAVKRLVKMGANINAKDTLGRTCLSIAAYQGWHDGVVFLLRNGAKKNICDTSGRTPLHAATYNQNKGTLLTLMQNLSPSELNQEDNEQMTALHWAAFHKRPEHVQELVDKGSNLLATDIDGKIALHWASQNGCVRSCRILASLYDADEVINIPDNSGKTAVHYAAASGHANILEFLASRSGCDLEPSDPDDRTPLHWAAAMGHADCVSVLLKLGVDPNPLDIDDQSPLEYAKQSEHTASQKLLESKLGALAAENDEDIVATTNLLENRTAQTQMTRGPIGLLKKLLFPKIRVGSEITTSADTSTSETNITTISGNIVTSETKPTSVIHELAKSSCQLFRGEDEPGPHSSRYSDVCVASPCDCSLTTSLPGKTEEDMETYRQKVQSDENSNTCVTGGQDFPDPEGSTNSNNPRRCPRATIQLHRQSLSLPGEEDSVSLQQDSLHLSRRPNTFKGSTHPGGATVRCGPTGSPRRTVKDETEQQICLSPGVTRKKISEHVEKASSSSRPASDREVKDTKLDCISGLQGLAFEDDVDVVQKLRQFVAIPTSADHGYENPSITRIKQVEGEGSKFTREPTPPPSKEESDQQVISSILRHSKGEIEKYCIQPKTRSESLPRLYQDVDVPLRHAPMQRWSLNMINYSELEPSLRHFAPLTTNHTCPDTIKEAVVQTLHPSPEPLLSKRHEDHRMSSPSLGFVPSPRRRRRNHREPNQMENRSGSVGRTTDVSAVQNASFSSETYLLEDKRVDMLEHLSSVPAATDRYSCYSVGPQDKTVTLPVLAVNKSGHVCNKDPLVRLQSLSCDSSPVQHRRQKQSSTSVSKSDLSVSSTSPRSSARTYCEQI